jgi:hypothetical protein
MSRNKKYTRTILNFDTNMRMLHSQFHIPKNVITNHEIKILKTCPQIIVQLTKIPKLPVLNVMIGV